MKRNVLSRDGFSLDAPQLLLWCLRSPHGREIRREFVNWDFPHPPELCVLGVCEVLEVEGFRDVMAISGLDCVDLFD